MAKDSEDETPDSAKIKDIDEGKNEDHPSIHSSNHPDHHHHTTLKPKVQKMMTLPLMLKTERSLKLLTLIQNING